MDDVFLKKSGDKLVTHPLKRCKLSTSKSCLDMFWRSFCLKAKNLEQNKKLRSKFSKRHSQPAKHDPSTVVVYSFLDGLMVNDNVFASMCTKHPTQWTQMINMSIGLLVVGLRADYKP